MSSADNQYIELIMVLMSDSADSKDLGKGNDFDSLLFQYHNLSDSELKQKRRSPLENEVVDAIILVRLISRLNADEVQSMFNRFYNHDQQFLVLLVQRGMHLGLTLDTMQAHRNTKNYWCVIL